MKKKVSVSLAPDSEAIGAILNAIPGWAREGLRPIPIGRGLEILLPPGYAWGGEIRLLPVARGEGWPTLLVFPPVRSIRSSGLIRDLEEGRAGPDRIPEVAEWLRHRAGDPITWIPGALLGIPHGGTEGDPGKEFRWGDPLADLLYVLGLATRWMDPIELAMTVGFLLRERPPRLQEALRRIAGGLPILGEA